MRKGIRFSTIALVLMIILLAYAGVQRYIMLTSFEDVKYFFIGGGVCFAVFVITRLSGR